MTAATAVAARRARTPALDRDTARRLMATEYDRVTEQLAALTSDDWQAPTCNPGWNVRDLAAHMLGMVAMAASLLEQLRQMRAAKKRGGEFIDALTAVQVERYEGWSPQAIVAELRRIAPKAVRGRSRAPGFVRRRVLAHQPVDAPREYEPWTFGYLLDVILTRDPWLHRSDIAIATGQEMRLAAEHDGTIVDDVVREWAQRHGRPCRLTLTGALARRYRFGDGGTELCGDPSSEAVPEGADHTVDAVEFCRILSGRGSGTGLLAVRVPF